MKRKTIYHIYYGTQGTAGLYIDEIFNSLSNNSTFEQVVFVSYYYPFSYGKKIFFRYSDILNGVKNRTFRLSIRYFELILALVKIFVLVLFKKPDIVNYSLLSSLYLPEKIFLSLIKLFNLSSIVFTCHDVIPFGVDLQKNNIRSRVRILNMADWLLVHNENSFIELCQIYGVRKDKIVFHPFPIMDLNKMGYHLSDEIIYDFAFQGHLREEKGVFILLKAWEIFHKKNRTAKLLIAGNAPKNTIDVDFYSSMNVTFKLGYISDFEYCQNIKSSRYLVLPYIRGTNSGIPSSVISLNRQLIVSDIPMFMNNTLISKNFCFESGNVLSLLEIMTKLYRAPTTTKMELTNKLKEYKVLFDKNLLDMYEYLLKIK